MIDTDRIRDALATVSTFLDDRDKLVDAEDFEKRVAQAVAESRQAIESFVLALMADEYVPVSLFKPFAGYDKFYRWSKDGLLKTEKKNGKVCVKPRAFFAFWKSLPH